MCCSTKSRLAIVRVRPGISTPKYNWGSVKRGDVGTVTRIDSDGDCTISSAIRMDSKLSEMEKVQELGAELDAELGAELALAQCRRC